MDSQSNVVQAQAVQGEIVQAQPYEGEIVQAQPYQPSVVQAQPYQPGVVQGYPQSAVPGMPSAHPQPQAFPMQQNMGGGDPEAPGPLYNPQVRQAMESTGEWSDGLFDCFDDVGLCLMSCCCGCCQQYRNIRRMGSVEVYGTKITAMGYIGIGILMYVLTLVAANVPPFTSLLSCVRVAHGRQSCRYVSVPEIVMEFVLVAFSIGVFAGFVKKFRIKEGCPVMCAKILCCGCCYLSQVSRHVFRAMGYLPPSLQMTKTMVSGTQMAGSACLSQGAMAQPMIMPQTQASVQQQQQQQQFAGQPTMIA